MPQPAERPGRAASGAGRVCVVAAPGDQAVADALLLELYALDVDARHHRDHIGCAATDASVLVVSTDALTTDDFLTAANFHRPGRVVPVRVGNVDDSAVPAFVADLNNLSWKPHNPVGLSADLRDALTSDLVNLEQHRELADRSASWLRSGRDKSEELLRLRDAKAARLHLKSAAADAFSRPTPAIEAYVRSSTKNARKTARGRIGRGALLLGLVLALVAVFTTLATQTRASVQQLHMLGILSKPGALANRPDREALDMIPALQTQGADLAAKYFFDAAVAPWATAELGSTSPSGLIDAALSADGTHTLSLDQVGVLTNWTVATGQPNWRRDFHGTTGGLVAGSDDLGSAAVAFGTRLELVTVAPWHRTGVTLPAKAAIIGWAAHPAVAVIGTADGRLLIADTSRKVREIARGRAVLAIRVIGDADVRVLLRVDAGHIALLDGLSGATLARTAVPEDEFENGAISPDGRQTALTNLSSGLLVGDARLAMTSTGVTWARHANSIALVPGGQVIAATPEAGAQVYDIATHTVSQRVCTETQTLESILTVQAPTAVACVAGTGVMSIWNPVQRAHISAPKATWRSASQDSAAGLSASLSGDRIHLSSPTQHTGDDQPVPPRSTVVGMTPAHDIFIGADKGDVIEGQLTVLGYVYAYLPQVPTRSAVRKVGWDADPTRVFVQTADGNYWQLPACQGCWAALNDQQVPTVHFPPCYPASELSAFAPDLLRRFAVSVCPAKLPDPQEA